MIEEITKDVYGGEDYVMNELSHWIQAGHFYALARRSDDRVVAILNVELDASQTVGNCAGMRVHPAMGGRGLASRIVGEVKLAERNLKRFTYTTVSLNHASQRVAKKNGLVQTADIPYFRIAPVSTKVDVLRGSVSDTLREWAIRLGNEIQRQGASDHLTPCEPSNVMDTFHRMFPDLKQFVFRWCFLPAEQAEIDLFAKEYHDFSAYVSDRVLSFGTLEDCTFTIVAHDGGSSEVLVHAKFWAEQASQNPEKDAITIFLIRPQGSSDWSQAEFGEDRKILVFDRT